MSDVKQKCCGKSWSGWSDVHCSKNAKVERDGRHYCGIHDPVRIKERDAKRKEKWDAKWNHDKERNNAIEQRRKDMEANAARYLWLRDVGDSTWTPFCERTGYSADQCDAAIDAARKDAKP